MQFLSFMRLGRPGFGVRVENGIIDLTRKLRSDIVSLKQAIEADLLNTTDTYLSGRRAEFSEADIQLLPVVPDASKILCAGLNYETHRAETKRPDAKYPTIFTRFCDTQIAHGQSILIPRVSVFLDYEAELAIVIGRGGRYISKDNALDHVVGYTCYNDATIRDWQRHTFQFTPGKNFPSTGAFGPQLVTADEVGDYRKLKITGRLNGEVMQEATLADLIFPIETLISYCSTFTALRPGDVILTGTPGGVGDRREPPVYMKAGDTFEVDIPRVGRLVSPIAVED